MITNVVFLKIRDRNEIAHVAQELLRMKGRIAPLIDISVRENIRDTGFDLVMTNFYCSQADMEKYLIDPLHVEVSQNIADKIESQASACYEPDRDSVIINLKEASSMSNINIPKCVTDYLAASVDAGRPINRALFAEDAHVHDIGEKHHACGIDAIVAWQENMSTNFDITKEVRNIEEKYGIFIATVMVSGDFPTSPQPFYYFFAVEDNLITNIEIVPGK